MRKLYLVLFSIAMVSTLVVSALVLIFPSHEGEMRTDLEVGVNNDVRAILKMTGFFDILEIE